MSGTSAFTLAAVLLCAGLPITAAAQSVEESAGVVTTVNGRATLIRAAALAEPVSLRMRDEIFMRDRIQTQPRSLVRVLLGGKALITVRELSILTVTEEANRVTVDLQSGKVGVAVVKGRMRPGEVIEIRSPNATAAVRGTVFVVDVDPAPAGAPSTTRVHLFQGVLDVSARLDPAGHSVRLAQMQSVVVSGKALGAVHPLSRDAVAALTADLKPQPGQSAEAPSDFTGPLIAREQGRAIALASTLLPSTPGGALVPGPLKNVKGAVRSVTGTVGTVTDGLGDTATKVTDTAVETLERLMDGLGLGDTHAGRSGDTLGNAADGLGNALGNVTGAGSGSVGAGGASAGPGAPPIVTSVAPPVTTPAAPPVVTPVAPPIFNPLTPVLNPVVNPLLNVLGGKK